MKRSLAQAEAPGELTTGARTLSYTLPSFARYLYNILKSKERDYESACDIALRQVQMGLLPPRALVMQFYLALKQATNQREAIVLFQFFMQLAALPDSYQDFAWNWAPVSKPATQGNLDAFQNTLDRLMDRHNAQYRLNALLWLRYVVAMLQRDIDTVPLEEVMLRRLSDATQNTAVLIDKIFDALQTSIHQQEEQRKKHKHDKQEAQEKHEKVLAVLPAGDSAGRRQAEVDFQRHLDKMEADYLPGYTQSVEATLLVQKLLSLIVQSQPQFKVGRHSSFDWTTLMDKFRDHVWTALSSPTIAAQARGKKASRKQRVLLATTDDPYLLFQFTGLFLSRDFGVKATIEAVEKRGLLELRHFLSTKTTAHPELMIEMIYYLLRSFLRHRGPGVTLEPISENIQEFIEHWTPLVKDNEYCATQLVSFQQFMISVAF